jgi:hypothetical protein
MMLLEDASCGTDLALALIARLAYSANRAPIDWSALPITDYEASLLLIRRMVFGDLIRAETVCPVEVCDSRIDVVFRVSDYLAGHRPRVPRGIEPAGEPGWFRFAGEDARFRLPTAEDRMAIADYPKPRHELALRCIQREEGRGRMGRRIISAMEAMAPSLSHNLQARCIECSNAIQIYFDVEQFVLRELRDDAAFIFQEIHILAYHYHWSEAEILSLPRNRRSHYAEMLQ